MAALSKPKYENFARNLSRGMTQADAYEEAGFTRDQANAQKLANNPVILQRIQEIKEERERILSGPNVHDPDDENDAGEPLIEVTEKWVIERLAANVVSAQSIGNHGAANKALEMLGHHLGMSFNDKKAPSGENNQTPGLGSHNTINILQVTDALHEHGKRIAEMKDITPKAGK